MRLFALMVGGLIIFALVARAFIAYLLMSSFDD